MELSYLEILGRLILATLLGGIIGYERESGRHYAGLRTHMLVSVSSALIGLGSLIIFEIYKDITTMDPLRVGAQVISGIGFLGAGAILKKGSTISGLTTAASLWGVAAIGLFTGLGVIIPSLMATLIIYISLALVRYSTHLAKKKNYYSIEIYARDTMGQIGEIGSILFHYGVNIININIENLDDDEVIIHLTVDASSLEKLEKLTSELNAVRGVKNIYIE